MTDSPIHQSNASQKRGTGFQPVNPWEIPFSTMYKRNLPHIEAPLATYFVTFRCAKRMNLPNLARGIMLSAIRHWDGNRIDLDAAVVMPDHVHLIFRIIDRSKLRSILHSIKSFSANQINKTLGRKGKCWLDENFDHIIRNAEKWQEKFEYVRKNPVKKGLTTNPEEYPFLFLKKFKGDVSHRQGACSPSRE